jgi:peptidoglycan/LPS O-acetylase OafA/YrhL
MLRSFAAAILVLNVIATVVAIIVNLPSQFGIVGTDAGREFLTSGTAISAPLIPVVSLLIVVAFVRRRDRWRWVGIAAGWFAALSVAIGGYGELVAEPTEDTPKAVLVVSGIVFLTIGLALAALSTAAAAQRPPDDVASAT